MTKLFELPTQTWVASFSDAERDAAIQALESGDVLYFPHLPFQIGANEAQFITPAIEGRSKNASFNIATGQLKGTSLPEKDAIPLRDMMARFASQSQALLLNLLPDYRGHLKHGRTSFRPAEVAGRQSSWRKDDTRLHVDAFPATPVQGKRLLRVFSNINPNGKPRSWHLGQDFSQVAEKFLPQIPKPKLGSSLLMNALHITKSRRSEYDHIMLQLHDRMKADMDYQAKAISMAYDFPAGATWAVFTDQASHAALAGQFMLEQTFYLPVDGMRDPAKSPLKILEQMRGHALI